LRWRRLVGELVCDHAAPQQAAPLHAPLGAACELDELQRIALWHGLTVIEPLPVVTADGAQETNLILSLHALHANVFAELVGERHD